MRPKIPICPVETTPKSTVEQGESRRRETPRLVWTRQRAGFYTCGDLQITRFDGLYGPLWRLESPDRLPGQVIARGATLRACQAIAEAPRRDDDGRPVLAGLVILARATAAGGADHRPMARARRILAHQEL